MTARRTIALSQSISRLNQGDLMSRSSAAAAWSRTNSVLGCSCKNVAGIVGVISPSTDLATTAALFSPNANSKILRAFRMVPTPIVMARRGTFSIPKKSLAASMQVRRSSVIKRVWLSVPEPGSLKPMCPVRPMPRICTSIPPTESILASYWRHQSATCSTAMAPSGMWVFSSAMST